MKRKPVPFVTLISMTSLALSPVSQACEEHSSGAVAPASVASGAPASRRHSAEVSPKEKATQVISALKNGHPDESAKLIREMLVSMQMELPMDPRYSTDSAKVLAEAPHLLKESFHKLLDEKHETNETKQIIDSLVDNTVPKDYDAQLKTYDKNLQLALAQLRTVQSTAETEALKYEDPLRSLEAEKENLAGTEMGATKLNKLGKTLDSLATQARFLPVGDVRAAVGLYSLTLVANGMGHFKEAETFAQQSINHVNAMADNMPVVPRIQIALAYALAKQGKNEEFKTLRDTMLKNAGDQENTLVTLARLTENTADYPGAVAIYKQALEIRTKLGMTRPPEWMDSYNELLKRSTK